MKRTLLVLFVLGGVVACRLLADEPNVSPSAGSTPKAQTAAEPSADETAIRQSVIAYVDAFNRHDTKALADFWSPDAVYLNHMTGEEVVGRAAIADQFTDMFKEMPEVKLSANTKSVEFISPNVAVERGISQLLQPKAEAETIPYSAVYVKRDGKWLLDRVTDEPAKAANSHYEQLKPLEWMIGHWVDKDKDIDVETTCNWTRNRTFITRIFTVSVDGDSEMSGIQVVGWDPAAKKIRSWTFDSNGGYAEGTWTRDGDRWFISNDGVLDDGRKASMVNVIRKVDDNSFTWQTVQRTAGGELLPDVPEVLIVRD